MDTIFITSPYVPPLMKTCFSSQIGKSTTTQSKIRPCLSFFGMTGSGDLLKFRFSKSSYSLSSKMGQDGQETPVTTRGKQDLYFVFSSLLQEKTLLVFVFVFVIVYLCWGRLPLKLVPSAASQQSGAVSKMESLLILSKCLRGTSWTYCGTSWTCLGTSWTDWFW